MGNQQPRKYAYFSDFTEEKMFIALCLGFDEYRSKFKVRKGDTILYIGEFDLSLLDSLPPCTLLVIDRDAPAKSLPEGSKVKCLRIRSEYPNFHSLFLAALREYQIKGSSLERLEEILNSTILSWAYNGGGTKRFGPIEPLPRAFYMETNSAELLSYII